MKLKLSPRQFADELERHLLGTEGKWDWGDTTSIAIADERLERIRRGLPKFDLLTRGKDRDELKAINAALHSAMRNRARNRSSALPRARTVSLAS